MKPFVLLALSAPVAVLLSGCGGGVSVESVSGTVKYNDKPVPNVTVTFVGPNYSGSTATDAEGKFANVNSREGKGIPAGEYKVVLTPASEISEEPSDDPDAYAIDTDQKPPFPQKYLSSGSSDLTATVKDGSNTFDFVLKD